MIRTVLRSILGIPFLLGLTATAAFASPEVPRTTLDTVLVLGRRVVFGAQATISNREDLNHSIESLGLLGVRRGVGLASDLNAEGFRRSDIAVVVDGERYHCACPNRMDPPTSLAIPIEVASATWNRTGTALGSGLAGQLALERRACGETTRVRGSLEGDLVRSREGTATAALESHGQRLSGRWTQGQSYRDARDGSFGTRYGFREPDVEYAQGDLAWRMTRGAWTLGAQGSVTRDVPYAYLQMDERRNELWGASAERGVWKLYANHTVHRMDNGLRVSSMGMSTAAEQLTVGALGRLGGVAVEAYGRTWNANNTIVMGASRAENHMLPRYRQWSANASRTLEAGPVQLGARVGLTQAAIGDESVLSFYRTLQPEAKLERWFVPFSLSAVRRWALGTATSAAAAAEVASEAPTAEQLYIKVHRPGMPAMKKPDWSGNPVLSEPVRGSLRGQLHAAGTDFELGGSWVKDYVMPVARRVRSAAWSTYAGQDAAIASGRAGGRLAWATWSAAYTLGWNLDRRVPLAEVAPFLATLQAHPPLRGGVEGLVRIEASGSQNRIDPALGESRTPPWGRLDLGLAWAPATGARASLVVENVTDTFCTRNLSYLRDPFASGLRVYEPGRSLRLALTLGD